MCAITTHLIDILGCGEQDILLEARNYLGRRLRDLEVRGKSSVHVGVELSQATDCSAQLAQESFAKAPKSIPTTPTSWAARRRPLSFRKIKQCRRKLGHLR